MYEGDQSKDRAHRKEHDPAGVEKRRVLARPQDQEPYDDKSADPDPVQQQATPKVDAVGAKLAARPYHGQGGTEEEAEGAGVGSFVDPRRVDTGLVDQGHGRGGEGCTGQGETGQPVTPRNETKAEQEQPGPDQIELLLHRQRPQVVERWRRAEASEVGGLADDVPP